MKLLTRSELQKCLTMADTIEAMEDAFAQLSSGVANVPPRIVLKVGDGTTLVMPAHLRNSHALGLKAVSIHDPNVQRGIPAILAFVALIDEDTGQLLALMDGTTITAIRTAAGSGLATKHLARADAKIAAIFGAGPQGRAHALAMCEVREIKEIRVTSAHQISAQTLAEELRAKLPCDIRAVSAASDAVRGADIICCCTNSSVPVFDGRDLRAGTHINSVGAYKTETTRETDDETIRRVSRIVVDSRTAALLEAGDILVPIKAGIISEQDIYAELGEIVLGKKAGRQNDDEITYFKSVGIAVQDIAAATVALEHAEKLGLGSTIDLSA